MSLQPRQIAKVAYEAIRAYGGTIGEADKKHWEGTTQGERDDVLTRVDAALRGFPHQAGIAPSEQIKARLLAAITDVFVQVYNPPVRYAPPAPPVIEPPPIEVEVFDNPDLVPPSESLNEIDRILAADQRGPGDPAAENAALPDAGLSGTVQTLDSVEPETVSEALAQADANIAKESE